MYIDVHNHVIPDAVLRLGEQDSRLGISVSDGLFRSPHHVPFPLVPAFHRPPAVPAVPSDNGAPMAPRRLSGQVEFRVVTFGYNRTVEEPLIKGFSFTAAPGQRLAADPLPIIVARSSNQE